MQRWIPRAIVCGLAVVLISESAVAQLPGPIRSSRAPVPAYERPAISPYLNLLDRSRNFESNYFLRVRPEVQLRQADARLRQSVGGLNRRLDEQQRELQSATSGLTPTGHTTSFLNYGGYFPLQTGR